jgi:hypothetical protein
MPRAEPHLQAFHQLVVLSSERTKRDVHFSRVSVEVDLDATEGVGDSV